MFHHLIVGKQLHQDRLIAPQHAVLPLHHINMIEDIPGHTEFTAIAVEHISESTDHRGRNHEDPHEFGEGIVICFTALPSEVSQAESQTIKDSRYRNTHQLGTVLQGCDPFLIIKPG